LVNQEMMKTAPISAVSMLGLSGFFGVFVFYFITGYLFNYILTTMKSRTVLYYIPLGLFVMFTLFSIQYNLRGASRFIYYSVIVFLMYRVFFKYKFSFGGKRLVIKQKRNG
jgi:hypothetical protein